MKVGSEEGQELANVLGIKLARMLPAVVDDEAPYPVDVGLLGPDAEVPNAARVSDLIEETRFVARVRCFMRDHGAPSTHSAGKA